MTHGTLTNAKTGQSLTGRISDDRHLWFDFGIDGCNEWNTFITAEWEFTPDPEPLPTTPGLYTSDAKGFEGLVYRRLESGWHTASLSQRITEAEMCDRMPLVRLTREDEKP